MATFTLARFLTPNNGVIVSEAGTDISTTAMLGQAVENFDTFAARINGTNTFTSVNTFSNAGNAITISAGRLSMQGDSTGYNIQLQYKAADGSGYIGMTDSATPDIVFYNNAAAETFRISNLKTATTQASTTTAAGLNLPHGTAPSAPVNGDMWTTSSGLFVRVNGSTVGPLS